ncbi:clarin-3 [Cheilinus undulatus]|uniref:clarin-3 n=1 Tax=Cheilinus undulatus TaxID=241271 RepID=UPI001BD4573A|nr:clarin-3 [Cheilinus undulatus]
MPSTKKSLHFTSSALVTAIAVGCLGFGMSAQWSQTSLKCSRPGTGVFNGSAEVQLELFDGVVLRTSCPSFGGDDSFEVFPKLLESGGAPVVLHGLTLGMLALCLLFSACSILISLYNSVSNPYETYMGPIGIYVCSSLSACLALLALIIYVCNIFATEMAEDLVRLFAENIPVEMRNKKTEMSLGFYMVIPYIVLSFGAIGLIFMYDHAAYTHRREQQRPTEDAPKEIMMY